MSTLATAEFDSSDDDQDADFILPAPSAKRRKTNKSKASKGSDEASGSSDGSSDDEAEASEEISEEVKKLKAERAEAEKEERRRKAAEAFASFKEQPAAVLEPERKDVGGTQEMVTIKRARRFAGETIYEEVSLPASDPEVVKYLQLQRNGSSEAEASADRPEVIPTTNGMLNKAEEPEGNQQPDVQTMPSDAVPADGNAGPRTTASSKPVAKGPPRRKPRQSLEAMSAALDKGKKMTTLEKSQMDWNKHLSSSSALTDELATHRRTGGFLEKRDFLDRVGDRRTDSFEKHGTSMKR